MNPDAQNTVHKPSQKKIVLISLLTFILLMLAITGQFTYTILSSDKVYKGVYIDDVSVSDLSVNELKDMLNKRYQDNAARYSLTLKTPSSTSIINYSDINVVYDIPNTVDKAFQVGRNGSIFNRIYDIVKTRFQQEKIDLPVSFNKEKLEGAISSLYTKTLIAVKDADLLIQEDKVVLRSGHHGENIDKTAAFNAVENSIKECKDGVVEFPIINTMPKKMDGESYYNKITLGVKDAELKVENNTVTVVPHVIGRSIDKQELIKIIDELSKTENTEKVLPVIFVKPKLTTEEASANLFKDTLYTSNTQFYTGTKNDANRGENIRIAVSKINGKILAPGETFSFNGTVGNRTEEGGYKVAHTYVGGKVVDGIGGGICQVSTTLYNAVLFSDLDVVERTNHMFTVGYVPLGRDAAVSFGDVDFKFKNSTNWPIKLEGWVTNDNKIIFSIKGKNDNPGKTIEIYHSTVKTLDFKTVYVDDPAVPTGTEDVKTEGMKGYVIDTFKIVKQDGKVVSEGKLHTSTYNPLDREIHRAPVKPGTTKPLPKPATGVDDAANPPAKHS
jgi:vancomycin resistance protein YoaR